MAKKITVRYSKAWAAWFTDNMIEQDLDVKGMVNKYPDKCPAYRTVFKWQDRHKEFDDMITYARECHVMNWSQELDDLTNAESPIFENKMEHMAFQADKRNRMDALKFKLAKIAPMLTTKYNTTKKVEQVGAAAQGPQIVVHQYHKPSTNDEGSNNG